MEWRDGTSPMRRIQVARPEQSMSALNHIGCCKVRMPVVRAGRGKARRLDRIDGTTSVRVSRLAVPAVAKGKMIGVAQRNGECAFSDYYLRIPDQPQRVVYPPLARYKPVGARYQGVKGFPFPAMTQQIFEVPDYAKPSGFVAGGEEGRKV